MDEPALARGREPPGSGTTALPARGPLRWLSWLVGIAVVAAVIGAALHFSEERELVRLAEDARPGWLLVAALLQAGTYLAQGEIWRLVLRAAHAPLPLATAFKLSLAKLFVDQAIPSAGLSGTVVVAKDLERRGVPRGVVMAAVVVSTASYYGAYVVSLAAAVAITIAEGHASALVIAASVLFALFGSALALAVLALSGFKQGALARVAVRVPRAARALRLLGEAEPRLARSPGLVSASIVLQLAIVLLDAGTIWVLVRSLGSAAPASAVFASFMVSTLLRTVSVIPGGLGTFEAASVVTLKLAGVSLPVALSATLLFRGLSFWLPMLPGLFFSRGERGEPPLA
ncbi:lysylphosphatidylglycerol synthase transmembrane domain-containing protein [Anaeromyxobacter terrae]|uniref:lysylphosphatidylglycerol synthase transmembrane domain-containing protein n=1 Tax=Anaeromyxobacter terrae TaxID=2925406 RepID=UPI001F58A642|nr:lysylphosphatidylglycerol synthase transmembrane domain-containing protein [Anaeromyxobacter sp. SG22]